MNLGDFIDTFKDAIAQRVVESYPPLYRPSENGGTLPRLLRKPLGAQADAIRGAALSLKAHRGTTVVGEMGTGKTSVSSNQCLNRRIEDEGSLKREFAALETERNQAGATIDWRFSTTDTRNKLRHIYPSVSH